MSTFSLVLQLWFTLSSALQPPNLKQRDTLRNAAVSATRPCVLLVL